MGNERDNVHLYRMGPKGKRQMTSGLYLAIKFSFILRNGNDACWLLLDNIFAVYGLVSLHKLYTRIFEMLKSHFVGSIVLAKLHDKAMEVSEKKLPS